jgi:sulfite dehydrogenase (quinone) subunit SoeC
MKPAPSIIFFTVASGAGYGMLFWLGVLKPLGLLPASSIFGAAAAVIALALIAAGLCSSLLHLGRPERAWRALSQWRSSWLSREGVAAILTFLPATVFLISLAYGETTFMVPAGLLSAAGAAITVYCTGMIYASLKPVKEWHHPMVAPGYLLFASFSGASLLAMLAIFWGGGFFPALVAAALGMAALMFKRAYWASVDATPATSTRESATGLGFIGKVRPLENPHTETNYLLREMVFRVGRVHAAKLRMIALLLGFALPALLFCIAIILGGGTAWVFGVLAAASALAGLSVERWLIFAEATHTVALYYAGQR